MAALAPATAGAVERRIDALADVRLGAIPADLPAAMWDPDRVPREWLPALAWALQVDLWDPDWDEARRREVVRRALDLRREHGTPAAIRRVLDTIGAVADIVDAPAPYRLRVTIYNSGGLLISDLADVRRRLDLVKRAAVALTVTMQAGLTAAPRAAAGHAGACIAVQEATL